MGFVCKAKQFVSQHITSSKAVVCKRVKSKFFKGFVRKAVITVLVVLVVEGLERRGIFLRIGKAADALIAAITDHLLFGTGGEVAESAIDVD